MLFKFFGVVMIIASSALIGFLKAKSLVSRCKKLELVYDGTKRLYECINSGVVELESAMKNSFHNCDFIFINNGKFYCDGDNDLTADDKLLINSFLKEIGSSVKTVECDRISAFNLKLKSKLADAQKNCAQKCKVYQTFGVCTGLVIGILLI